MTRWAKRWSVCLTPIVLGALSACAPTEAAPAPTRAHAAPGAFTTIAFQADNGQPVTYLKPETAVTEIVVSAGVVKAPAAQATTDQRLASIGDDQILLTLRQTIKGAQQFSFFTLTTGRTLEVAMNGLLLPPPKDHRLALSIPAGQDSLIILADAQVDTTPFANSRISLVADNWINHMTLKYSSQIDLDTGKPYNEGDEGEKQSDVNVPTWGGVVNAVNGAKVAEWKASVPPTAVTCQSIPRPLWFTKLDYYLETLTDASDAYYFGTQPIQNMWCIRTNDGRLGVIAQLPSDVGISSFAYVIWKKIGD